MARNDERRQLLVNTALTILAQQGARGLSYRAIDTRAKVPQGTTSNYFRTRAAIVQAILERISERLTPNPEIHDQLALREPNAELFTDYLHDIVHRLLKNKDTTLALFELRLEAARNPEIAATLGAWRRAGLEADQQFTARMGLPITGKEVQLFHYVIDGLILDQLTVPLDTTVDPEQLVVELAARVLAR